ncbi:glycerophosphodiester phosphodiesterase [Paenibacillus sp. 1P07SE]|uniref:glycerophosphodiester phosphodiesterase n=1 Tax=Paenibacillus sp. 1P07SE TaxID=3132209 RepID=UPI0039A48BA1
MMRQVEIIAHTGCEGTPDNTIESCYAGYHAGASVLEVDVRTTKDHIAVLHHDDIAALQETTYAELISGGRQLERLDTVLKAFKGVPVSFNLDLKTEEAANAAMAAIEATETWEQVWFTGATSLVEQSPHAGHVMWNLPNISSELPEEQYRSEIGAWVDRAARAGYRGINAHYESCRRALVEEAHGLGLQVWIYTLPGSPVLFERYADMEVDGISVYDVSDFVRQKRERLDR